MTQKIYYWTCLDNFLEILCLNKNIFKEVFRNLLLQEVQAKTEFMPKYALKSLHKV